MKPSMKMMMLAKQRENGGEMQYRSNGDSGMYSVGRERYNDGRYAPRSEVDRYNEGRYVPPQNDPGPRQRQTGYRMDGEARMIGFYGGDPEYRSDYRMDASYQSKDEMTRKKGQKQSGHASASEEAMDKRTAKMWVKQMGETWDMEKTEKLMERWKIKLDPAEFYATINMLYSDFGEVAEKHGISGTEFWVDMAKAFLEDEDAKKDKLQLYYEYIVEK